MNKHNHSRHFANSARFAVALCALAALGGPAAHAQATIVTNPNQLGNTVQTSPYPSGNIAGVVPPSFTVAAGSNNLTFTATGITPGMGFTGTAGFESFIADNTIAPQFTAGDQLEDTTAATFDAQGNYAGNKPTGPLRINFQTPVTGFGLFAQDFNFDTETFTLNVFNNNTSLGIFTFGPTPNGDPAVDPNNIRGTADFIGAQSNGGPLITSAIISSASFAVGPNPTNGSNDFYFGPTRVQAPVPEASTVVSFGMGVLLFASLALVARKRKVSGASQAG